MSERKFEVSKVLSLFQLRKREESRYLLPGRTYLPACMHTYTYYTFVFSVFNYEVLHSYSVVRPVWDCTRWKAPCNDTTAIHRLRKHLVKDRGSAVASRRLRLRRMHDCCYSRCLRLSRSHASGHSTYALITLFCGALR